MRRCGDEDSGGAVRRWWVEIIAYPVYLLAFTSFEPCSHIYSKLLSPKESKRTSAHGILHAGQLLVIHIGCE